jgi:hypothetical protein
VWVEGRSRRHERLHAFRIEGELPAGTQEFRVHGDAAGNYWRSLVGQPVTFQYRGDMEFIAEVCGQPTNQVDWQRWNFWKDDQQVYWEWTARVAAFSDDTVRLAKGLRLPVRKAWNVTCGKRHGTVQDIILADFSIEMPKHRWRGHLKDAGYSGIFIRAGYECLVQGVSMSHADNGVILEKTCNTTIRDLRLRGGGMHHGVSFRNGSHDNLVRRFTFDCEGMIHGISSQDLASGNVWADGVMEVGTIDSHGGLPFDSIRTDIALRPTGWPGGTRDSGPRQGRRMVNWNIRVLPRKKMKRGSLMMLVGKRFFPAGALVGINADGATFQRIGKMARSRNWNVYSNYVVQASSWGRSAVPCDLHEAQCALSRRR